MSSFYLVCTPTNDPASDSLSSFEAWLTRTFPGARVTERDAGETHALGWTWLNVGTDAWLNGWISKDRTSIYLSGDIDLVCETAFAAAQLFPAGTDGVLVNSSVGIVFDLRRMPDAAHLADAVLGDDETLEWHDPG